MLNRLECLVYLTYISSRDYKTKDGRTVKLYTFKDEKGNTVENTLNAPLDCELNTVCICGLICGNRYNHEANRYEKYWRVISATPKKK